MAETPPALMEMDGVTAPRLAFLFHAGLWLPAPHEKHPLPMAGSPVFAFAQQKNTIQAGPCKLQSVSRFGFGDGKTKEQSSVYLTYPVSAGITVTNSPGFSPDSAADAQGAGRSVLLLTCPHYIRPSNKKPATKSKHYFSFRRKRGCKAPFPPDSFLSIEFCVRAVPPTAHFSQQ